MTTMVTGLKNWMKHCTVSQKKSYKIMFTNNKTFCLIFTVLLEKLEKRKNIKRKYKY